MTESYCNPSPSAAELATEAWLPIPGGPAGYEVSSLGRVSRVLPDGQRRVRALSFTDKGYLKVGLPNHGGRRTRRVHDLVAAAFLGERPPGPQVNHIDGNKTNNRPANLEWVTGSANKYHYWNVLVPVVGRKPSRGGHFGRYRLPPSTKLNQDAVLEIRRRRAAGESGIDLAAEYGVTDPAIYNICNRRTWRWVTDPSHCAASPS